MWTLQSDVTLTHHHRTHGNIIKRWCHSSRLKRKKEEPAENVAAAAEETSDEVLGAPREA